MRRGSVRVRLTLLFGGLFLVAGAALLGITYGLVSHATNGIIINRIGSTDGSDPDAANAGALGSGSTGSESAGGTSGPPGAPSPAILSAQALATAQGAQAAENDALLLYSGIALAIMAVASVALGWFAAGRALRPLRRITGAAQRISATNLHERLALDGPDDDLRELADTIDDLFARLDASFDAQRQFVANASHELRTPLARARTLLEVALRDPGASTGSLRTACERALAAGAEQERLIEALLVLARGQRGLARREPVDLAAITRDVLAARSNEVAARGLTVAVTLAPALLAGDAALTERAVANLVDNALRHNVPGGTVTVNVGSGRIEAGRFEAGSVEAGSVEAGNVEAGRAEAGRAEAGSIEAGRAEAGSVESGRVASGGIGSGGIGSDSVGSGSVGSGSAESGGAGVEGGCADRGGAVFVIANSGPEIPAAEVGRLLLPFQRGAPVQPGGVVRPGGFAQPGGVSRPTRPHLRIRSGPDAGLGLGLSIVSAIATAHGAAFEVTPRAAGGLSARLTFPAPPRAWLSTEH